MEPGFLKPGNPAGRSLAVADVLLASMEPGFLKPGNRQTKPSGNQFTRASMEPGFLKPGNRAPPPRCRRAGRRFNGARLPEARKPFPAGLGWGGGQQASMEPGFLKPGNK